MVKMTIRMVIGGILFSIALGIASWFRETNPISDWLDAILYVSLGCYFASQIVLGFPDFFFPRADYQAAIVVTPVTEAA